MRTNSIASLNQSGSLLSLTSDLQTWAKQPFVERRYGTGSPTCVVETLHNPAEALPGQSAMFPSSVELPIEEWIGSLCPFLGQQREVTYWILFAGSGSRAYSHSKKRQRDERRVGLCWTTVVSRDGPTNSKCLLHPALASPVLLAQLDELCSF